MSRADDEGGSASDASGDGAPVRARPILEAKDGPRSAILTVDGSLHFDGSTVHLDGLDGASADRHDAWSLSVVQFDATSSAVLLVTDVEYGPHDELPEAGDERRYRLFRNDGGQLRLIFEVVTNQYGPGEPSFPGDGSARYRELDLDACFEIPESELDDARIPYQEVIFRFDEASDSETLVEVERRETSETFACRNFAG